MLRIRSRNGRKQISAFSELCFLHLADVVLRKLVHESPVFRFLERRHYFPAEAYKLLPAALDTVKDSDKLKELSNNIARLALPDSATVIAKEVLKLIK